MSRLLDALRAFAAAYHERPALVREQEGWTVAISLVAEDTGAAATATLEDGRVAAIAAGAGGGLEVRAAEALLIEVLDRRRGPSEPYLFGELTVRGAEADFVRLDYLVEALCPA